MKTPNEINPISLITPQGFDSQFFKLLGVSGTTQTKAYDELEEIHFKFFGRRRYTNIDSYRKSRNKRLQVK